MIVVEGLVIYNFEITKILISILVPLFILGILRYSRKQEYKIQYYRQRPDDLSIPVIQYYNEGKFNNKTLWLMILDFIQKDYYSLVRIEKDKYKLSWRGKDMFDLSNEKLTAYEKDLMSYINTYLVNTKDKSIILSDLINGFKSDVHLNERIKKMYDMVFYEIKTTYGNIDHTINYIVVFALALTYFHTWSNQFDLTLIIGTAYALLITLMTLAFKNIKFNFKGLVEFIAIIFITIIVISPFGLELFIEPEGRLTMLVYFNPLLILSLVDILRKVFYNSKQHPLMLKVKGFRNFLTDFTRLKDRPIDYINFVKHHYVLAEALNVKLTDQDYVKTVFDDDTLATLDAFDYADIVAEIYMKKHL